MSVDYGVKVVECEPLPDYRLKVKCSDGTSGVFDMSSYMDRGVYRQIRSPKVFNDVRLIFGVPTWLGDIDIAAERVRSDMTVA
ncbi:DUF2442 domain-containing protein [Bifidobacterium eulemuris]|uniref:DUF2442 domain-containing protein n=1 Tax=Bifidobacterium eulemuris TaxID=1765219 RepID=A0A261FXU8_9BIFI|nr:DUF2442 domain-containing protein [Bifidobacterium eulemuris]OZG64001.1 hypothetical protein BEUL_2291 [Bifidobacterium eulemuris]QOL32835.1 DUF2442 domain-containing protein [Bifidobacterium eulemuris]